VTERGAATLGPALLFCPGERPERFGKAVRAASIAVLDLEDGTARANKQAARQHVRDFVAETSSEILVRINHPKGQDGLSDVEALRGTGIRRLLLPKTEAPEEIAAVLSAWGEGDPRLIVTIETAKGLSALSSLLSHPSVEGVGWGPYDLAADMGVRSVRDASGRLRSPFRHARDRLLIEAAACGVAAYDTVTVELADPQVTRRDSEEAAELGFAGKFCIHPSQVETILTAFRPSSEQVAWAERLLAGFGENGAALFEGEMVDEPILRRARRILAQDNEQGARSADG
jgi:citrate lyase subunit beta/citryl-CoA lyase